LLFGSDASAIVDTISAKTARYRGLLFGRGLQRSRNLRRQAAFENFRRIVRTPGFPIQHRSENLASDYDTYAEGKRMAEAVLFQKASFPVVSVRFPIILGPDDYSKRLRFQVRRISSGEP
jgi:nucleoside-diphosphate-sugar epimerase